jgi:hypothetical protein
VNPTNRIHNHSHQCPCEGATLQSGEPATAATLISTGVLKIICGSYHTFYCVIENVR